MTTHYEAVATALRSAYDGSAAARDEEERPAWKTGERDAFLARVLAEGKQRLLEVGAGPGHDSQFFQDHGLDVVATDLSPEMVRRCRAKGITAHEMDFLQLRFPPASFEVVFALNCLLHVPNSDLPRVLAALHELLVPGGLLFIGVYGGDEWEGIKLDDWHDPPRFFVWRSDEQLLRFVRPLFDVVSFRVLNEGSKYRFQSLTLRRPGEATAGHRGMTEE